MKLSPARTLWAWIWMPKYQQSARLSTTEVPGCSVAHPNQPASWSQANHCLKSDQHGITWHHLAHSHSAWAKRLFHFLLLGVSNVRRKGAIGGMEWPKVPGMRAAGYDGSSQPESEGWPTCSGPASWYMLAAASGSLLAQAWFGLLSSTSG